MGAITTHVLDTARGQPGAGIHVELYRLDGERRLVSSACTDARGRTPEPLLGGADFQIGLYELVFRTAEYFSGADVPLTDPPFLDVVTVRVGIAHDEVHHIPLLISPWSYSVYRGA